MELVLYAVIVLGVLGAVFGAILAVASKIFAVEVDPKQAAVRECLAGANCGGCGFPGCDGYAAAVAKGEAPVNKCVAAGPAAAEKIAEIMSPFADSIITVTTPGNPRALSALTLAETVAKYHNRVTAADSLEEAVEMSYLLADKDSVILAFGSLSYLGQIMDIIDKMKTKRA